MGEGGGDILKMYKNWTGEVVLKTKKIADVTVDGTQEF